MDWRELVGKRVLVRFNLSGRIVEAKVVEVSPSGRFVALRYDYGKHWHSAYELTVLEVLNHVRGNE